MGEEKTKVLLIENGLLGDYCATAAVGQTLRKIFPGAQIALLVKKTAGDFFATSSWLDEILFFDLPWTRVGFAQFALKLWIELFFFSLRIRKLNFDYIVTTKRNFYQYILLFLLGGKKKFMPPRGAPVLYTERALSVVRELGFTGKVNFALEISNTSLDAAENEIKNKKLEKNSFVIIHPGASYILRRWYPAGFAELDILLSNRGIKIAYMGRGESDRIFMEQIGSLLNKEVIYFDLPLAVSIAVVSLSKALIGMDSGFSHIAATLGIPTVALYGPASARYTGITGPKVKMIDRHHLCTCHSRHLCIPYSSLTFCSLLRHTCKAMLGITPQEVYMSVCEMLGSPASK